MLSRMVSTLSFTAYWASTYRGVRIRSGVSGVRTESTASFTSGLHTERSSEYLPAAAVPEVVAYLAHPIIKTEHANTRSKWRILFDYDTAVVHHIVFHFLVFNVAKHPSVWILNAYFVVSTGNFLRLCRHHLFLRRPVGLRLATAAAQQRFR